MGLRPTRATHIRHMEEHVKAAISKYSRYGLYPSQKRTLLNRIRRAMKCNRQKAKNIFDLWWEDAIAQNQLEDLITRN